MFRKILNESTIDKMIDFDCRIAHQGHMLFLCSGELVLKSPVSLSFKALPAMELLNIDCDTNFFADNT